MIRSHDPQSVLLASKDRLLRTVGRASRQIYKPAQGHFLFGAVLSACQFIMAVPTLVRLVPDTDGGCTNSVLR